MKLTKDEARILAAAIEEYRYDITEDSRNIPNLMTKLEELTEKLSDYGKDQRRTGRTSQDYWTDMLKRFAAK
jgi:uncharacterized coiled-coil DUF342 family protein